MTTISDEQLYSHGARFQGRVALITGAANGIGKQTALKLASFDAKVVIGDRDIAGAQNTVDEIKKLGGNAVARQCDVTVWDQLVDVFELAISQFGSLDVVVANAGLTEVGEFSVTKTDKNKRPVPPETKTLQVNLIGTIYTTSLARYYLSRDHDPQNTEALKALVLLGSMASWQAIPLAPMYSASKHGVLGLMRSLAPEFELLGIRVSVIHPWFADTGIVPISMKLILTGIPLTPVERIAGAIIYSASSPGLENHGCAWLLPDDGPVFQVPPEEFKLGVYGLIDTRRNALLKSVKGVVYVVRVVRDLSRILHLKAVLLVVLGVGLARYRWVSRSSK